MRAILTKIRRNLRRPLPDLCAFAFAKLMSRVWARQLGRVGARFHVSAGARIQGGRFVSIGDVFYAGPSLWIEAVERYADIDHAPRIEIGAGVTCSGSVHIAATSRVTIGEGVLLGSHVHITDHAHGSYSGPLQDSPTTPPAERRLSSGRPVVIERNVWLGDGVVVLPGVRIGEGSVIGANSVVSRDVPPNVIAVGAPAVAVKAYDPATSAWLPIGPRA
jgi:acetyltransferase-like isoleucine patch superfamily enzyme